MQKQTRPSFSYAQGSMQLPKNAWHHAFQLQPLLLVMVLMIVLRPRESGGADLIPLVVVPIAICAYWWLGPLRLIRAGKRLQKLEKDLPWFRGEPVTCHALPGNDDLALALGEHGYAMCVLDGETIRSWQDLADALQAFTDPMPPQSDPREQVRSILAKLAWSKPRKRAIIWRNASASALHHPALVTTFASEWAAHMTHLPIGLLVFVDLPDPVVAPDVAPHGEAIAELASHSHAREQPDRSILKEAPDGSWWKPQPGELT